MYLPFVPLFAGVGGIGSEAELHDQQAVVVGIDGVFGKHVVNRVVEITVAAQEVNLRVVGVGIRTAERGGVAARSCHCGSQTEVAVRIDGKLSVGVRGKRERELAKPEGITQVAGVAKVTVAMNELSSAEQLA